MYDFQALGERLAEKHGLYKVEKGFETDYFLIKDTSFVWSEVLRTFKNFRYIVYFNTPEKVTTDEKGWSKSEYDYCYNFERYRMEYALNMRWPGEINNQFKQEHFNEYPLIDIEDCLDKMLILARKDLNDLLIKTKKSEIKGAGSKYIL